MAMEPQREILAKQALNTKCLELNRAKRLLMAFCWQIELLLLAVYVLLKGDTEASFFLVNDKNRTKIVNTE
jgi:hypothetical protein